MILVDTYRQFKKVGWFLPGFILYAAFPPMCEVTDVLFALAPLMWLSRQGDPRTSAKRWFMSGMFFWVATLSWMPAIVKNGGPWPLVVLGWGALAAYCAAYFAAYGYLSAAYWKWARFERIERFEGFEKFEGGAEKLGSAMKVKRSPVLRTRGILWRRLLGVLVVEPILWAGLELVRSRFLGGFAWNQLGVVPANAGFGAPAAVGGVYLLSAVVILINGTFAGVAERMIAGICARWRKPYDPGALSRLRSFETLLALALVWGVYSVGGGAMGSSRPTMRDDASGLDVGVGRDDPIAPQILKVAMVQRNFPCVFKAREEDPYETYSNLLAVVSHLPREQKPDLVVLPESAMCEFGPVNQQGAVRFARWTANLTGGAALLAGGTRFGDGCIYNSAALYQFKKDNSDVQPSTFNLQPALTVYDKVHLVPFGEFIPGDKWFPALQKLAPVGSCTPGVEDLLYLDLRDRNVASPLAAEGNSDSRDRNVASPLAAEGNSGSRDRNVASPLAFGVAICFEDTDSALMRRYAAKGARFLCFITNDSWFSHSNEALAHAWQATARAIETGLPVVRVGNSGVTGTITPDGKACYLLGADGKPLVDRGGAMRDRIVLAGIPASAVSDNHLRTPTPTTYTSLGDTPLFVAFALLICGMILVKYVPNYGKHRTLSL